MEKIKFIHKVSKGSRFNQIYIPKQMQENFQVGDSVEVILLERKSSLYYSKGLDRLNEFKEALVKNIFLVLKKYREIDQIFIIGSFLTQREDFNDIDVILISEKNIEKEVSILLTTKFELKFHIVVIQKIDLENLIKYCPMTRSMLYNFISDKDFKVPKNIELNKEHIRFLLMMPEDLLTITLSSRPYYDSIRRLITIERFLENKTLDPDEINKNIKDLIGEEIYQDSRKDKNMDSKTLNKFRAIIRSKLNLINNKLQATSKK